MAPPTIRENQTKVEVHRRVTLLLALGEGGGGGGARVPIKYFCMHVYESDRAHSELIGGVKERVASAKC